MFMRLKERLYSGPINDIIFTDFYKLFFAAHSFYQNDTVFLRDLINLKHYLLIYMAENIDKLNRF